MVLNQSYEPLAICSPKKAIILLYLSKADLISDDPERELQTVNNSLPFPSVIKLSNYKKVPFRSVEITRRNIFRRDNHQCQYCGSKTSMLTIDHIFPKSRGGLETWENLVTACFECNNRKGNRTPEEAKMPLLTKPSKPSYVQFMFGNTGSIKETWKPFLYM